MSAPVYTDLEDRDAPFLGDAYMELVVSFADADPPAAPWDLLSEAATRLRSVVGDEDLDGVDIKVEKGAG